jgi:uncharacterized protein (DUF1800 family)
MTATPQTAIAAHRFGLGEADLSVVGPDPAAWLKRQVGPADAQGTNLASAADGLRAQVENRRRQAAAAAASAASGADPAQATPPAASAAAIDARDELRDIVQGDIRARLLTAATTPRPFAERLAMFWANHFTVTLLKGTTRGLVGAFEREAIRPHIGGRFIDLLRAATTHPAMLRYLDNQASAGPHSLVVQRLARRREAGDTQAARLTGLNENLGRELLELHTLGAAHASGAHGPWGGYSQADVTALAALLTGWRGLGELANRPPFEPNWHEPGDKVVLNRRYSEGPQALDAVLIDLARHPSTARHIATKLARHFIADEPPPALVSRLAKAFADSDGDLPAVYAALIDSPEAWAPQASKLKTPEEFVVSTARLLRVAGRPPAPALLRQVDAGIGLMGQRMHAAPSPAGWPDRAEEWLGPEALWQRVEWASRVAERAGSAIDARQLALASLGPRLSDPTRVQIDRAADPSQAMALLLMSPDFQRR